MERVRQADRQFDVFLSHNSGDKPSVERLAARLEDEAEIKPFLDKWHLVPGEPWQEALEEALDKSATCAVFLGPSGLGSWENEEMRSALDARHSTRTLRVIPVLLPGADPKDPATLPRFLRRLTWVDFRSGLDDGDAFHRLAAGVRGQAPGRSTVAEVYDVRVKPRISRLLPSALKHSLPLLLLTLPTLVVIVGAILLMGWHVPARVEMDLTVSRVVFTVGDVGIGWTPLLKSVHVDSITVENFASLKFSADELQVANPAEYDVAADQYPESAWRSLTITPPVVISGEDETLHPAVTVRSAIPRALGVGTLDSLTAQPGSEVTMEVSGSQVGLTVMVEHQESRIVMTLPEAFQLIADYVRISSITALPFQADSLTYRARLASDPNLEIAGLPDSLTLVMRVAPGHVTNLFSEIVIPVTHLDLTRQDATGARVTALVKEGELSYPGYPDVQKVTFKARDAIVLDQLEKFRIEKIALDRERKGLRLYVGGIAGQVRGGSPDFPKDYRLTLFDQLTHNPVIAVLFGIILWVFPTTVGAYRLYRELKS